MNYIYKETELYNLKDQEKEAYIDYSDQIQRAYFFKEILRTREHIAKNMEIIPSQTSFVRNILVWDGINIVGNGEFYFSNSEDEKNPELCEVFITIHPNYTRQGIATEILRRCIGLADKYNKTKMEIFANNYVVGGKITEIIAKLGLKFVGEDKSNALHRNNINHQLLKDRIPELQEKLKEYKLVKFTRKEYLEKILGDDKFRIELADFRTEVLNLIPKEESSFNDRVITPQDLFMRATTELTQPYDGTHFLLFNGNEIIGFTGTYYPKNNVRGVNTGLTGVRKRYQRKGIGMYLKLLMVEHYLNYDDFQLIITENAQSNAGMLKINYDIGFRHEFSWLGHEGEIESVKNYLHSKSLLLTEN